VEIKGKAGNVLKVHGTRQIFMLEMHVYAENSVCMHVFGKLSCSFSGCNDEEFNN